MEKTDCDLSEINVFFKEDAYEKLNQFLSENEFSKLFVLVDSNTHEHCLPRFLSKINTALETEIIEMEPGEESKDLETCQGIWNVLSELGGDRKSLMINLGGGVVTDLGGFVAAAFKRGIPFINVPTTLLAMVDAAVGGKTGVNLQSLKNQIGVIKPAEMVLIDTVFLKTLPAPEMRSGLSEMLKHGLIKDEAYWNRLLQLKDLNLEDLDQLILESIQIKATIVAQDPTEQNLRKSLNFGHTLGHAIESYFLDEPSKTKLLHGEAVAAGMVMAGFISQEQLGFPSKKLAEISRNIISLYGKIDLEEDDFRKIKELLKFDKKNERGNINFVLLKDIGRPVMDCQVPDEVLNNSCSYYLNIS